MKSDHEIEHEQATDVKVAVMDVATIFVIGSAAVIGLLIIGLSALFSTF